MLHSDKAPLKPRTFLPFSKMATGRLLVHSARQVVQVVRHGERVLAGAAMSTIACLGQDDSNPGYVGYSIVVGRWVEGKARGHNFCS